MVNAAEHRPAPTQRIAVLSPQAPFARTRPRHRWLAGSFVALVLIPVLLAGTYLYTRAVDQFASTVGFSVRKAEVVSPVEFLGGIADIASSGSADADILYEFITSQQMVRALEARLDLSGLFARAPGDPVFAFRQGGAIEDLHRFWTRMVRVVYDPGTGILEVRVLAFRATDAQAIATGIFLESTRLVDDLSAIAQDDTTAFARAELTRAVDRLKTARAQMTAFRSRTQIVDPSADLQGQMGLMSMLQQQLAEALIDTDLLRETTRADDQRLLQGDRRIAVIEARIADERRKLGVGGQGAGRADYATLLSEFERLAVDREFAETAYTAALAGLDQAQAEARRKSRYLAAHIAPTLAETAQFPRRAMLLATLAFFLAALWAIGVLIFYSLRDRR